MTYLTDGVHLYEVLDTVTNYGRTGGVFRLVRDSATEAERMLSEIEGALCEEVR